MIKFKLLFVFILVYLVVNTSVAISPDALIKQGSVAVTISDIDGYSYKMPQDLRNGFFESIGRLDSTISTILTMKHIVKYAQTENLLDDQLIHKNVREYLLAHTTKIEKSNLTDLEFLKLKNYLILEQSYRYMQKYLKSSFKEDGMTELAREEYEINKQKYYNKNETRNIQYINIKYTENNKKQKMLVAQKLSQQLQNSDLDFNKLAKEYAEVEAIEFIDGIDDFYYNDKFKDFSDFVFTPDKVGLIDNFLDVKNRYIIAIITKISPQGYKKFEEVKPIILAGLLKKKVQREFGALVLKLTQDPVEVNTEAIQALRTRY